MWMQLSCVAGSRGILVIRQDGARPSTLVLNTWVIVLSVFWTQSLQNNRTNLLSQCAAVNPFWGRSLSLCPNLMTLFGMLPAASYSLLLVVISIFLAKFNQKPRCQSRLPPKMLCLIHGDWAQADQHAPTDMRQNAKNQLLETSSLCANHDNPWQPNWVMIFCSFLDLQQFSQDWWHHVVQFDFSTWISCVHGFELHSSLLPVWFAVKPHKEKLKN